MSKQINPVAIGSFTLAALTLIIVGIFMFGGHRVLTADKVKYVVFFNSSLNGLEIGAPVKIQGVKIGQVTEIALQFDKVSNERDNNNNLNIKLFKPVVIEIDKSSTRGQGGVTLPDANTPEQRKANRDTMVGIGFRARLETQSLLTGLLYVDLDVHPDKPPVYVGIVYKDLLELPGLPTTTDEIISTAEEFAEKVQNLPLDEMVHDMADSLKEIKTLLASNDLKRSITALANTLEELEKTSKTLNHNLAPMLTETRGMATSSNALLTELHHDIPPLIQNTDKTMLAAISAMKQAELTLQKVGGEVGPDSTLTETLRTLQDAARSLRDLSDFLERHPEALISGKNIKE